MKLRFSIHYATAWGESLHVVLTCTDREGRQRTLNLRMQTDDGESWNLETAVMESRQKPVVAFEYFYQVEAEDGTVLRQEWRSVGRRFACDSVKNYILPDSWRDKPLQWHLYTRAFRTAERMEGEQEAVVYGQERQSALHGMEKLAVPLFRRTVIFRVSAPQLTASESLGVCGSHPSLGDWSPSRYLRMEYIGDGEWMLSVNIETMQLPVEYKYVVIDNDSRQLKTWEEGDNRRLEGSVGDGDVMVCTGETLRLKEATWKIAGVSVPVFSLRSEHSFGVGDFGDLRRLVDWAITVGMKVIQVLPVNDTTCTHSWTDSHPYNCISHFALHPHYLDLEQMGLPKSRQERSVFNRQRRELNSLADSDYMAVDRVKTDYMDKVYSESGVDTMETADYRIFFERNKDWLVPYAVFCALRDKFGTSRFTDWPQYADYDERVVWELAAEGAPLSDGIRKTYFVQYHLYRQLLSASEYARKKGVILKGDMPVGVYRDSVEVWSHRRYFNLDEQMGTPPSSYEPMGQNWGFPTFRWSEGGRVSVERQHQAAEERLEDWLRRRLSYMEQFFDAVRIDHIASFFRTWVIPLNSLYSVMGHYSPALPLSEEEIGRYGLTFRRDLFTRPFINDRVTDRLFGVHARYVREHFLSKKAYGLYELVPDVDTQVKIRQYFDGQNDENSQWIRDGLMQLCANVLFLEDSHRKGMYHPRFGVFNASVYEILSREEKDAYMRLYNDYFYERHNDFWHYLAQRKLSEVFSETRMLVCAEDLGLLPDGVDDVLDSQRILTLEVQTLPKQHQVEFARLSANPYRSVATISTHDMPPLRLWWEEDTGRVQRYYASMLQKEGRAPRHLPAHLVEEIIARYLYCPSMLCILSMQDWLGMDAALRRQDVCAERINAPFDSYNQWKYRVHLDISQLMDAGQYNEKVRTMIKRSKRI